MNRMMARRPQRQGGFTLVELLVVIVILGILSAVVVFAVRGSGDKGRAAAVATDERIIRTAEEAYCAKTDTYGTMDQLRGEQPAADGNTYKFLSGPSEYHNVALGGSQGNCAGKLHYSITVQVPKCGDFGGWCPAAKTLPAVGMGRLLALPSGNVLASEGGGFQQFDPTFSPDGKWSPLVKYVTKGFGGPVATVLLQQNPAYNPASPDDPMTKDWCGSRCGQVMSFLSTGPPWYFYDPAVPPGVGSFVLPSPGTPDRGPNDPGKPYNGGEILRAVQITGRNCPPHCGQVFINYGSYPAFGKADIFDPISGIFSKVPDALGRIAGGFLVALADGRVLSTSGYNGSTFLFVPGGTGPDTVVRGDDHLAGHGYYTVDADIGIGLVLDNEDVLYAGPDLNNNDQPRAELFHPLSKTWEEVPPCGDAGDCFVLAKLNDGRVLGYGARYHYLSIGSNNPDDSPPAKIYLFDPVAHTWTQTGSMQYGKKFAERIGGVNCVPTLPHCGEVIAIGAPVVGIDSELYKPP